MQQLNKKKIMGYDQIPINHSEEIFVMEEADGVLNFTMSDSLATENARTEFFYYDDSRFMPHFRIVRNLNGNLIALPLTLVMSFNEILKSSKEEILLLEVSCHDKNFKATDPGADASGTANTSVIQLIKYASMKANNIIFNAGEDLVEEFVFRSVIRGINIFDLMKIKASSLIPNMPTKETVEAMLFWTFIPKVLTNSMK